MTLAQLLGTRWPLVQAPMAGVQGVELALAVSRAGALGSIPAAMLDEATLHQQLQAMQAAGQGVFNVNFFCHKPPHISATQNARWLTALAPAYQRLGLTQATAELPTPSRFPFSRALAEVLAHYRPSVISFHFGLPDPQLLAFVRSWGAVILSSATTVEEGHWLAANGADVVIAQGLEAGGHRGSFLHADPVAALSEQSPVAELLPALVKALTCPVIAAGGIDGPQAVARMMRLGASGVQVGTAYLLCDEAQTGVLHRAALQDPLQHHTTALTNLFTGRPARGLVNRAMRDLPPLHPDAPPFPLAGAAMAPLRAEAEKQGLSDFTPLWAGQNAHACRAQGAQSLTESLVAGFARYARS